jgi:hypothetical protein
MKVQAIPSPLAAEPKASNLLWYVLHARWAVALTSPLLYACLLPFALLDLFSSVYQAVCFRVYAIPLVVRSEHIVFDRARLRYLNPLEKLNCLYCSYASGVAAYVAEIAARTEQHWCPIQHERHPKAPQSRYPRFLAYGDARGFVDRSEEVRRDFQDLD